MCLSRKCRRLASENNVREQNLIAGRTWSGERSHGAAATNRQRLADLDLFFDNLRSQRVGVQAEKSNRIMVHAVRNPLRRPCDIPVLVCDARMWRAFPLVAYC